MTKHPPTVLFEACVDSVASAVAAAAGGAGRLELCDNLAEGGTTPSAGMIARCVARVAIPVVVIIRPRGGDFLYDGDEVFVMGRDIEVAKESGAAGVAVGALCADGTIDAIVTHQLLERARPLSVTFHRAFDMTANLHASLDTLIALGVDRVLTSGGATTALEGKEAIAALVQQGSGRITIMAGGGVRPANVGELVRRSGVDEVHARLTEAVASEMRFRTGTGISRSFTPSEFERSETSRPMVAAMVEALQSHDRTRR